MKIIGHRGAAGLAPENTLASLKAAQAAGVDAIELDVRITADNQLVVCHDPTLLRTYAIDKKVSAYSAEELASISDAAGNALPTLQTAANSLNETVMLIEGKGPNWAGPLAEFMKSQKDTQRFKVISFNHHELLTFHRLYPSVPCFPLAHHNAMEAIQLAHGNGLAGIDINHWLLNPLVYWLCKRQHLEVIVYTINNKIMARFISWLYPNVQLTTDVPNQLQFLRPARRRQYPKSDKILS